MRRRLLGGFLVLAFLALLVYTVKLAYNQDRPSVIHPKDIFQEPEQNRKRTPIDRGTTSSEDVVTKLQNSNSKMATIKKKDSTQKVQLATSTVTHQAAIEYGAKSTSSSTTAHNISEFSSAKRLCQENDAPLRSIKYIKTHKTGSSTLTNILHRFGVKHNLRFALPKDNIFYAWPHGDIHSIPGSVESIQGSKPPYEMMCSAHVRYIKSALDAVVPDGTYITILREPVSHFLSSWSHWHVWEHMQHRGAPRLTLDEFLQNVDKYQKFLSYSDRILLLNSFSYDLGVQHPTQENIEQLIAEMESEFAVVLITEHMLESLVLLRRTLCWTSDDILHLSLKVTPSHSKKDVISTERKNRIYNLNWADTMLYRHFNNTLWKRISQEKEFFEEVNSLKESVAEWSNRCARFRHFDEDAHRVQLEEIQNLDSNRRTCHYMWLDSKGFVKHLKKRLGYPVEELECWATHANIKIMYLVTDHPADDDVMNVIAHYVGRTRGRIATPDYSQGPDLSHYPEGSLIPPPKRIHRSPASTTFLIPGFTYDRPFMDQFYQGLMYIATLRHPVQEFLDAWTKLGLSERIKIIDPEISVPLDAFLDNPDHWLDLLSEDDFDVRHHLIERTAYRLGVPRNPTNEQIEYVKKHILWFAIILVAEYPDESMVMLRRTVCWKIKDIVGMNLNRWKLSSTYTLEDFTRRNPNEVQKQILALNPLDAMIYSRANLTFWDKIARQVSFKDELDQYRAQREAYQQECNLKDEASNPKNLLDTFVGKGKCAIITRTREEMFRAIQITESQPFNPPPHA